MTIKSISHCLVINILRHIYIFERMQREKVGALGPLRDHINKIIIVHRSEDVMKERDEEGRGGELKCYIHTFIHTDRHTDRHTEPPTKRVLEEHSLQKQAK